MVRCYFFCIFAKIIFMKEDSAGKIGDLLLRLKITQLRNRGMGAEYRYNPYNPLCYILLILFIIAHLLLNGINGVIKYWSNPFKWDFL